MKSYLLLFSIFFICNFSWAQSAEEKAVNGVFISYINDDGKACNKCNKALQSYPNNQKLLNFKKLHCNLSPPPTPLTINFSKTNVSSSGGSDGTAKANVSGGTPPYQYSWSNGNNGSKITNLAAGKYTVTVTDNAGNTKKASVTISSPDAPPPPPPALKLTLTHSNVSAAGKSDGSAKVSVSGGKAPYQYDWSNGDTGSKITNLSPGTYKVTVTDNSGKTKTGSVTIADKKPESIDVNLRETSQNKFAWSSKLSEKGASVKLKITAQGLPPFTVDVSNQSSYTFSTGNSLWDGMNCIVELIITAPNEIKLFGNQKFKTKCACKP